MKNNGFTIVELIVTIVVLSIIGVFTFHFIISGVETYVNISAGEDIAREGRLGLERMVREVRYATNIVSPAAGISDNTIVFNRTPTATDSSTQVTFQVANGTLQRKRDANTPEDLASNASSFTVSRNSGTGELITLDLTLSGQTTIRLRTLVYPRYFD